MTASRKQIVVQTVSLGCAKNLVDAEVMCGTLATDGILLTDDSELADVLLINTCGFIQSARDEAEAEIQDAIAWKKQRAGRRVIVSGCYAQRSGAELARRYPEVDAFLGIDEVPRIAEVVRRIVGAVGSAPEVVVPDGPPKYLYDEHAPRLQSTPETYAYVKIAEGCNHRCAFCAIPGIRGNQRSRTPASVLAECRQLLAGGVHELILIAQDTTAYGRDLPDRPTLAALLQEIDALPGDFWIRVLYTHPLHLTSEFLELLDHGKHLLPYLDVPLQHIDDAILASMRRGMTGQATLDLMHSIREQHPHIWIRSTLMTGYPGETQQAFETLRQFVADFGFDRLGVFAFSPEEGTPAAAIATGLVPHDLAEQRAALLLSMQKKISLQRNRRLIGTKMRVLLEEEAAPCLWNARGPGDAPDVDQTVLVRIPKGFPRPAPNTFLDVRIATARAYELTATPASPS